MSEKDLSPVFALRSNLEKNLFSRRSFLTSASMTITLSACGGGEGSAPPVLLPIGSGTQQPQAAATMAAEATKDTLWPGRTWTGVAGSGFATPPTDPVRTTAKPAMRLIVPPNQAYSDELIVGVSAFANNGGTLFDNLGIEKIIVHYEGSKIEIAEPSRQKFNDVNDNPVSYTGWWTRLKNDNRFGDALLFFEAVPKDRSMQNRVIGPFLFMPSSTLYDLELTVAPSQPEVAGSRYSSIRNALSYCASQGKHHPHITITEARTDYLIESMNGPLFSYPSGKGYVTIDATVPVTIIGTAVYTDAAPRTKYDGMRFKGANITLDYKTMQAINCETGNRHWLDGVKVINSGGRSYIVPELKGPSIVGLVRGGGYFTECSVKSVPSTFNGAQLVRGCNASDGFFDCFSEAACVLGNRVDDYHSYDTLNKDTNAFTVTYTGNSATATLELSGFSDAESRIFTVKENGAVIGTKTVTKSGPTTLCSEVVTWINSLSGWSATLQSDLVRATACSKPLNIGGAFTAINVKGKTLQIVTFIDSHGDVYQTNIPANTPENVVVADNVITNFSGQCFFLSTTSALKDFVFINNAFHDSGVSGYTFYSQFGRSGAQSHIVVAHNSMTQGWLFRPDSGFKSDTYCLFSNNVVPSIAWTGTPDMGMQISHNHCYSMSTAAVGSVGSSFGGSATQIWPTAASGNFAPSGNLLMASAASSVTFDWQGRRRAESDAQGAVAR